MSQELHLLLNVAVAVAIALAGGLLAEVLGTPLDELYGRWGA